MIYNKQPDIIDVLYGNCQSVINKIDELRCLVCELNPHVICLNETWTNDQITDAFLSIPGYNVVCRYDRTDTSNGRGGGLLVYSRNDICLSENIIREYSDFNQCCGVKLPIKNRKNIELVLVYRPHEQYDQTSVIVNNMKLNDVLRNAPQPNIFLGDFNYSSIDWTLLHSDSSGKAFMETVQNAFLHQHVDFCTILYYLVI